MTGDSLTDALLLSGLAVVVAAALVPALGWLVLLCRRCGRHYFAWGDYCRRCRRLGLARARRPFNQVYAEAQAAHDGMTCGGTAAGCRFGPEHER